MFYRLRLFVALFGCLLALEVSGEQLEGIKEFSDGTPAVASEVNSNNLVLSNKALELEARILRLEDTSDRLVRVKPEGSARIGAETGRSARNAEAGELVELLGGKLILENVDCTDDPYALNRAYVEHSQYSYILFGIIGDCYGDITSLYLGDASHDGAPFVQEHGQVINIQAMAGYSQRPKIIPNPDCSIRFPEVSPPCTRMGLVSSFGGGLYIGGVDLEMGAYDNWATLFSRGSTGQLDDVTITTHPNSPYASPIRAQHAANPYLGNVTINGGGTHQGTGIAMTNNAAMYIYGVVTIEGTQSGLRAESGSSVSVRSASGGMNITTSDNGFAIQLTGADMHFFGGYPSAPALTLNGNNVGVQIFHGSRLYMQSPLLLAGDVRFTVEASNVSVVPTNGAGVLTADNVTDYFYCRGLSTVTLRQLGDTIWDESEIDNGNTCLSTEEWQAWASQTFPLPPE